MASHYPNQLLVDNPVLPQYTTLEPGQTQSLPSEALHILHPIDDDWSAQDVCKCKHMGLLERSSWLAGQAQNGGPVLVPLVLVQRVLQVLCLDGLPFFVAWEESGKRSRLIQYFSLKNVLSTCEELSIWALISSQNESHSCLSRST